MKLKRGDVLGLIVAGTMVIFGVAKAVNTIADVKERNTPTIAIPQQEPVEPEVIDATEI